MRNDIDEYEVVFLPLNTVETLHQYDEPKFWIKVEVNVLGT